jgi:S1-C subfamily serine protease
MLSAGYLAAVDAHLIDGRRVDRWVVNAAFNSGNSGGPLLQIETGEVIGVVSSKLAPISQWSQEALRAMEGSAAGAMYTVTYADGSTKQLVEGQIVASILNELRSQVQLVIGYAVTLNDLKSFLVANGLEA